LFFTCSLRKGTGPVQAFSQSAWSSGKAVGGHNPPGRNPVDGSQVDGETAHATLDAAGDNAETVKTQTATHES
jgi:hypothetical protein